MNSSESAIRWLCALLCIMLLCGPIMFAAAWVGGLMGLMAFGGGTAIVAVACCAIVRSVVPREDWLECYGRFGIVIPALIGLSCGSWAWAEIKLSGTVHAFDGLALVFVAVYAFVAAGVTGMAFAFVDERRRQSAQAAAGGHCRACGYRIDNIPGPRCPECGTRFAGEPEEGGRDE